MKPGFHLSNWVRLVESKPKRPPSRRITMSEIRTHNLENDCWTIHNGKVYDITEYLPYHPGGVKKLMLGAGADCTELFNKYHRWVNIDGFLGKHCIGILGDEEKDSLAEGNEIEEEEGDEHKGTTEVTAAIEQLLNDKEDDEV